MEQITLSRSSLINLYLSDHPLCSNADIYAAFPDSSRGMIRRLRAQFLNNQRQAVLGITHPPPVEWTDPDLSRVDEVIVDTRPPLTSTNTEDVETELLRLYNGASDEERLRIMKGAILEIWKFKHRVPIGGATHTEQIDMSVFLHDDDDAATIP